MKTMIIMVCLLAGPAMASEPPPVCPHNQFSCLQRHMDAFYQADHDRFYGVYKRVFAAAMRCQDYRAVANYLTIYSAPRDNADIDASMEQDTEALLLLKPVCLFEGVLRLEPQQRANFIGKYHLFSRPNHVMAMLRRYMKNPKYKIVANKIYQANLEAYNDYGKALQDADMSDLYNKYGKPR